MSKILLSLFLTMALISNSIYAGTVKSSKSVKQSDSNKTMTDEEFLKEMEKLDNKSKEIEKTRKTLDEIKNKLNVK